MTTHISKGDTLILDEDIRKQAEAEGVEKFVVGAVIHDGERVLVVTRSQDDDFLPGLEEVPSGGVDAGGEPFGGTGARTG